MQKTHALEEQIRWASVWTSEHIPKTFRLKRYDIFSSTIAHHLLENGHNRNSSKFFKIFKQCKVSNRLCFAEAVEIKISEAVSIGLWRLLSRFKLNNHRKLGSTRRSFNLSIGLISSAHPRPRMQEVLEFVHLGLSIYIAVESYIKVKRLSSAYIFSVVALLKSVQDFNEIRNYFISDERHINHSQFDVIHPFSGPEFQFHITYFLFDC